MGRFERLDNSDIADTIDFLRREAEHNMLMLHNVVLAGLEEGDRGIQGHYFGIRESRELVAVAAVYDLGSMLLYGHEEANLEGLGEYLAGIGSCPRFIGGKHDQVKSVIRQLEGTTGRVLSEIPTDLLALRDRVNPELDTSKARKARPAEVERLVDMQVEMEMEMFDGTSTARSVIRELMICHIEEGTSFVLDEGDVVAKAEGRIAGEHGASIGGVFTLPAHRGRGHGTNCVAALCLRLLEEVPVVALDAAKKNRQAQAIYHKIGFEKLDDRLIVTMAPVQ